MDEQPIKNGNLKLYSQSAIWVGTFLGGPLAAAYLIKENYKAFNLPEKGRNALLIGVISTVLLLGILFALPENLIDRIPRQLLPLIYTGIVYFIVERYQGPLLKQHKENGYDFFSRWKAVGIGLIAALILAIPIFVIAYLETQTPGLDIYEKKMIRFRDNEAASLEVYDNMIIKNNFTLISELTNKAIPKSEENIEIAKDLQNIPNLPSDLKKQNELILEYSKIRLEVFQLTKKSLIENTNKYEMQINSLNARIEDILGKMESQ